MKRNHPDERARAETKSSDSQSFESFISEPITPERGAFDPALMRAGLASLPEAFTWRGRRYRVTECISHQKVSSREGGRAQGELYLRRQEFVVRLHTGQIARLYVERHARPGLSRQNAKKRWFFFTRLHPVKHEDEPAELCGGRGTCHCPKDARFGRHPCCLI